MFPIGDDFIPPVDRSERQELEEQIREDQRLEESELENVEEESDIFYEEDSWWFENDGDTRD